MSTLHDTPRILRCHQWIRGVVDVLLFQLKTIARLCFSEINFLRVPCGLTLPLRRVEQVIFQYFGCTFGQMSQAMFFIGSSTASAMQKPSTVRSARQAMIDRAIPIRDYGSVMPPEAPIYPVDRDMFIRPETTPHFHPNALLGLGTRRVDSEYYMQEVLPVFLWDRRTFQHFLQPNVMWLASF